MKALRFAAIVTAVLATAGAYGQITTITASNIVGDDAKHLTQGEIDFLAVTLAGNPIQPQLGGGGVLLYKEARCLIVNGAITTAVGGSACTVADTHLSNQRFFCYKAQVRQTDVTPNRIFPWIPCLQPYGSTWNLDTQYTPANQPTALVQLGPPGPPGAGGTAPSTTNLIKGDGSGGLAAASGLSECPAGQAARGIADSGNARDCFTTPANVTSLAQFDGLVGAFTDSSGTVIEPLWIGRGPVTLTTPPGATQLQLGVNDSDYTANAGSWTIAVNGVNRTVLGTAMPWINTGGLNPSYPVGSAGGTGPTVITGLSANYQAIVVSYVSGTITDSSVPCSGGSGSYDAAGEANCFSVGQGFTGFYEPGRWVVTPPSVSSNPMIAAGDMIVGGVNGYPTRLPAASGWLHWNGSAYVFDTPPGISYPSSGLAASTGSAWRAPVFGNVVALWTSCTSGWLKYDGSCSTPSSSTAPSVTFNVATGSAASPAAPYMIAPVSGTVSHCYFTTLTSDGATNLVFNVKFNGTSILSGSSATVTAGSSAGTISTFSLTSGTVSVTSGQKWEFDITGGTSAWTGAVQCY